MKLRKTIRVLGCRGSYCKTENNCRISIHLLEEELDRPWYFVISHKSDIFSFNSSWNHIMFSSKRECLIAADDKLRELVKVNFAKEYDNVHTAIYK